MNPKLQLCLQTSLVCVIISYCVSAVKAETIAGQFIDVRRATTNDLNASEQIIGWLCSLKAVDPNPQRGQWYYYWARMITAYKVTSPEIDYLDIRATVTLYSPKQAVDNTLAKNVPIKLQINVNNVGYSELSDWSGVFRVTLYDQENGGLSEPQEIDHWTTDLVISTHGVSKTIIVGTTKPVLDYDQDNTTELYAKLEILNTSAQPESTPVLTVSLLSDPSSGPVITADPNETTSQIDLSWTVANGTENTIFSLIPATGRLSQIIYVDKAGVASDPNGDSWETAYYFLQDALLEAQYGDSIYVAAPQLGNTYTPDVSWDTPAGSGLRTATFNIPNGVKVYGGFPTHGSDMDQRNSDLYPTTLSGDINIAETAGDNSYHVVTIAACDANTALDGFVIESGYADGLAPYDRGAGLDIENSEAVIRNCTIRYNAAIMAAGIYCKQANPAILNCLFWDNDAGVFGGAGMYNQDSSPTVQNCRFILNTAHTDIGGNGGNGGAVYNESSEPVFTNCEFKCNTAKKNGGGVYNWDSEPELINCTFSGNIAAVNGGGMCNSDTGGYVSPALIENCIFWGNRDGNTVLNEYTQIAGYQPVIYNSCVQDETPGDGSLPFSGTVYDNIDSNPEFVIEPNPGPDGQWDGVDDCIGDLKLQYGSPCIEAGNNLYLPEDSFDIDGDDNIYELIPLDAAGHKRLVDRDKNLIAEVDIGAFERGACPGNPDLDDSDRVDFIDFAMFADQWQQTGCDCYDSCCSGTDLNGDETVDLYDLQIFAQAWLTNPEPADNPQIKYWAQNGHYYECVSESLTWRQAKIAAESRIYKGIQGHLATITSESENSFILNTVAGNQAYYWIGGIQLYSPPELENEYDLNWHWITGEAWDYTNWRQTPAIEPNDGNDGPAGVKEDVLEFRTGPGSFNPGEWNDAAENLSRHFIVEYE